MTVGETKVSGTPTCPRMAEVFVELPPIAFCNGSGTREVLVLSTGGRLWERVSAADLRGLIVKQSRLGRGCLGIARKGRKGVGDEHFSDEDPASDRRF
jgi:hypothetical protein